MGRLFANDRLQGSRMQRVFNAAERYVKNIQKQKAYTDKNWDSDLAYYTNYGKYKDIQAERNSRQYSRRQYMGISG